MRRGVERGEQGEELTVAGVVVGKQAGAAGLVDVEVERGFGDVNPDVRVRWVHGCPRLQ